MNVEKIGKQFETITEGSDQELVKEVCSDLWDEYRRGELGYLPRRNLDAGNQENIEKQELSGKICSWVNGLFGFRSNEKISHIEKIVQTDNQTV